MKTRLVTTIFAVLLALAALSSQALAQQKTAKACEAEWRANKAEYQAKGVTMKAYVAECRAGGASAKPATAPAAKPATTETKPSRAAEPAAKPAPTGAHQFSTVAQAKARCPTDAVVWVNLESGIYHFSGYKSYGHTKEGAYMCEKDTAPAGFRAAKNEKHPK